MIDERESRTSEVPHSGDRNPQVHLRLFAGKLGTIHGTLDPSSGVVRCIDSDVLDNFTAARTLRMATQDGLVCIPDEIRARIDDGSLVLTAGVVRG